ncbi:polymorphic toxin type 8 domain-containing protein [Paenibacillus sp. DR312]|nr:polymorphic toxin type 8 domain-containing protein [Paenibacillus sp. DR312]
MANEDKVSTSLRGEIKLDLNEIKRKKRKNVRVPQGYQMQHKRGFEARKGYGYEHSVLNVTEDDEGNRIDVAVPRISTDVEGKEHIPIEVAIEAAFFILSAQVLVPSQGQELATIVVSREDE